MSEFLAKHKNLAPWIGMLGVLFVNIAYLSFLTGKFSQQLEDNTRRIMVLEQSDKEQGIWLTRIVKMEENVQYLRDEWKIQRDRQEREAARGK